LHGRDELTWNGPEEMQVINPSIDCVFHGVWKTRVHQNDNEDWREVNRFANPYEITKHYLQSIIIFNTNVIKDYDWLQVMRNFKLKVHYQLLTLFVEWLPPHNIHYYHMGWAWNSNAFFCRRVYLPPLICICHWVFSPSRVICDCQWWDFFKTQLGNVLITYMELSIY